MNSISLFSDCMASSRHRNDRCHVGIETSQSSARDYFTHDDLDDDDEVDLDSILPNPPRETLGDNGFVAVADVGSDASSVAGVFECDACAARRELQEREGDSFGHGVGGVPKKKEKATFEHGGGGDAYDEGFATTRPSITGNMVEVWSSAQY